MQWSEDVRDPIKKAVTDISNSAKTQISQTKWNALRVATLKKYKHICRCCGGTFDRYLFCIRIDGNSKNNEPDNLDLMCKACYIIKHINYGFNNEIEVGLSKLSQLNIVRRTIDHVMSYNRVPTMKEIDPDAEKVGLSIMELSNVMITADVDKVEKYKIFFTPLFDTGFIKMSMFVDEDEPVTEDAEVTEDTTKVHKFTKDERVFLNEFFKKI
jgi:hypothetical protein